MYREGKTGAKTVKVRGKPISYSDSIPKNTFKNVYLKNRSELV
jgi:hypothetical protein